MTGNTVLYGFRLSRYLRYPSNTLLAAKGMEEQLKANEARIPFRVLAFVIAIPAWLVAVSAFVSIMNNGANEYTNWNLVFGVSLFALSMSWVAIAGYVPKILLRLFSRSGRIMKDKDLK